MENSVSQEISLVLYITYINLHINHVQIMSSLVKSFIVLSLSAIGAYFTYSYFSESSSDNNSSTKSKSKKPASKQKSQKSEDCNATVGFYQRHVLVGTGVRDWPEKIEKCNPEEHPECALAVRFSQALKCAEDVCAFAVKLSASSDFRGTVTIFPDQVRYENVSDSDVSVIVNSHLVAGEIPTSGKELSSRCKVICFGKNSNGDGSERNEKRKSKHKSFPSVDHAFLTVDYFVLICTHMQRDRACGIAGPQLMAKFKQVLEEKPYAENLNVKVLAVSHIGGHKYAGNCIIYENCDGRKVPLGNGKDRSGEDHQVTSVSPTNGDWYGYLDCDHVELIVQEHFCNNRVVYAHWRGRMGVGKDAQKLLCERFGKGCDSCVKCDGKKPGPIDF